MKLRSGRFKLEIVFLGSLLALVPATSVWATDTDCTDNAQDASGYSCNVPSSVIPDISVSGTTLTGWKPSGCSGDDCYKLISTIGGSFTWYGNTYSAVYISSNGYVSFGAGYTNDAGGSSVPDTGSPNNAVFAYGDDLDPSAGGTVKYQSTACSIDTNSDTVNDHCFVVLWNAIPQIDGNVTVTVALALNTVADEAYVEISSESGVAAGDHPNLVGTENGTGTTGLWFKNGADPNSSAATTNSLFRFAPADITAPADISKLTSASGDLAITLEWVDPVDSDLDEILVLSQSGAAVTATPTDGTSYNAGDSIGSATVACVAAAASETCTDSLVSNGLTYHYKLFAADSSQNYSPGVTTTGFPRAGSTYKWASTTDATTLAAVGAASATYLVGVGNDRLLQRMAESTGQRGSWVPPTVGGAVQSRPMCGDLNPGGAADMTCYVSAQNGRLYRFSLDDGTTAAEATRNVAGTSGDAGCTAGLLQASAVVMLDAFDTNGNNNDDVVVVATRCGSTNNKIQLYDHMLATQIDSYDGGGGLGISNAAATIYYREGANNLVYVPVRDDGGESLVVLEVDSTPAFATPEYAVVTGIGDIDAAPLVVRKGSERVLLVGNNDGVVFAYSATTRVGGAGSALSLFDSCDPTAGCGDADGAVRGLGAANGIWDGISAYVNWLVWSTDSRVHGIKHAGDGTFDESSYWSIAVTAPSTPIVLRDVSGSDDVSAYVGNGSGQLLEIDSTTGTITRTWSVEPGTTTGDPTFDYNDGSNQGIVIGTTGGTYHWVKIN